MGSSRLNQAWAVGVALLWAAAAASSAEKPSTTLRVSITFEAGAAQYQQRPGGGETMHRGIGYIDPYGRASYYCGKGYAEEKQFPFPDYFTKTWLATYVELDGPLFCEYRLVDGSGSLFVYDSIVGNVIPADPATGERVDQLLNVVVGASGIWTGYAKGRGMVREAAPGQELPESILKLMEGYIKLPGR